MIEELKRKFQNEFGFGQIWAGYFYLKCKCIDRKKLVVSLSLRVFLMRL